MVGQSTQRSPLLVKHHSIRHVCLFGLTKRAHLPVLCTGLALLLDLNIALVQFQKVCARFQQLCLVAKSSTNKDNLASLV